MNERGFTLPELAVFAVIIVTILIVSSFLLRPADLNAKQLDTVRRLDIAHIAQALKSYAADTGRFPPGIPTEPSLIGSAVADDEYNLCALLTPDYLQDIPVDPAYGQAPEDDKKCSDKDATYYAAYTIARTAADRIVVGAPMAASGSPIQVTIGL
jgi:type II secretory pathway pseudopilin PulG